MSIKEQVKGKYIGSNDRDWRNLTVGDMKPIAHNRLFLVYIKSLD